MIGSVDATKKLVLRQKHQNRVAEIDEQVNDLSFSVTSDENSSRMNAIDPDFSVNSDSKVLDIDYKQHKKRM